MIPHLAELFYGYFDLIEPSTPELMKQVYTLRYLVYCLETQFEDPAKFTDEMEIDQYDERSVHSLIQHRETGLYAATTRLVLADHKDVDQPFPIELYSQIDRKDIIESIPRRQIAEVSRFCVSKSFKRRIGEPGTLAGLPSDIKHREWTNEDRRSFPLISIALITCMIPMAAKYNVTHWYAVMEPALIRYLKQLGIDFIPIGPASDYHGLRIPCIINVQDLLDGVHEKNPQAWELITDYGRFAKIA